MHGEIRDERRGRDKARLVGAEQALAETPALEFDDVQTRCGERNAHDLELARATGLGEVEGTRAIVGREHGLRARRVLPALLAALRVRDPFTT